MTAASVALTACVLLVSLYGLHKVRRMHLMQHDIVDRLEHIATRGSDNLLRNLQALRYLERLLDHGFDLPPLSGWAASPDMLLVLARHARAAAPRTVVECGCGASTLVLARCAELNCRGHVYALDHDPRFAEETRERLREAGLERWATVIDAPLTGYRIGERTWQWYDLSDLPHDIAIDLLFVDGPPMPMNELIRYPALPLLYQRLAPGAAVFLDDADRPGERRIAEDWRAAYPELIRRDFACEKGCVSLRVPSAVPVREETALSAPLDAAALA